MDGEMGAAERLGKEAEQSLAVLAQKLQLSQSNHDFLQAVQAGAEDEERRLLKSMQELKDLELMYKREAEEAHKKLAQKGAQFQELTRQASERLNVKALQLETAQLHKTIADLQAEEARLMQDLGDGPFPPVDLAAVSALLAQSRQLKGTFQQLAVEQHRVCTTVRRALSEAGAARLPRQAEEDELAYCRLLEEAVEEMTLLQVEAELSGAGGEGQDASPAEAVAAEAVAAEAVAADAVAADAVAADAVQAALTRLALQRDEYDVSADRLAAYITARVAANAQLAVDIGLQQQEEGARLDRSRDDAAPDSTTPESPSDRPAEAPAAPVGAGIAGDPQA